MKPETKRLAAGALAIAAVILHFSVFSWKPTTVERETVGRFARTERVQTQPVMLWFYPRQGWFQAGAGATLVGVALPGVLLCAAAFLAGTTEHADVASRK